MPNYTKKRNKNDRIRKTFRNIIGGVKNNKGRYNNGKSYLTNIDPHGSYWPTEEVEHPSIMKRLTTTMRRFLPWSSKPQYMPVEEPQMKTKTKEELRKERISDLIERERWHPGTVPKNEWWKVPHLANKTTIRPFFMSTLPKKTIIKTARKLPNSRRLRSSRSSRKLRSSAN
jgi:hypothetical protein